MNMSNFLNPAGTVMFTNTYHLTIATRIGRIFIIVMNMREKINVFVSDPDFLNL